MKCDSSCPLCHGTGNYDTTRRIGFSPTVIVKHVTVPCPNVEKDKELIIVEGLIAGNRFFSTNIRGYDERLLANGKVAYRILGYADTSAEAQLKLYGETFPLDDTPRQEDNSMIIE